MDFTQMNLDLQNIHKELIKAEGKDTELDDLQEVALNSINKSSKLINDMHQAVLSGKLSMPEWTYMLHVMLTLFEQIPHFTSKPVFEAVVEQLENQGVRGKDAKESNKPAKQGKE